MAAVAMAPAAPVQQPQPVGDPDYTTLIPYRQQIDAFLTQKYGDNKLGQLDSLHLNVPL